MAGRAYWAPQIAAQNYLGQTADSASFGIDYGVYSMLEIRRLGYLDLLHSSEASSHVFAI